MEHAFGAAPSVRLVEHDNFSMKGWMYERKSLLGRFWGGTFLDARVWMKRPRVCNCSWLA